MLLDRKDHFEALSEGFEGMLRSGDGKTRETLQALADDPKTSPRISALLKVFLAQLRAVEQGNPHLPLNTEDEE